MRAKHRVSGDDGNSKEVDDMFLAARQLIIDSARVKNTEHLLRSEKAYVVYTSATAHFPEVALKTTICR